MANNFYGYVPSYGNLPKKTLQKYNERQPHLDARNEPYLLRIPVNNHRGELMVCSLVYLAVAIMMFVHGYSTLTTTYPPTL